MHITPIDPATAATRLRRQLARLESGRRFDAEHGRLLDPHIEAATEDAYELADRVARGEARLFTRLGSPSPCTPAASRAGRAGRGRCAALAASLLIDTRPTTYRALHGWFTGLPLGLDRLGQHRGLRHRRPGRRVPLRLPRPPAPRPRRQHRRGRAAGRGALRAQPGSRSLVFWDRFACDNYNSVVLGRSGAGKSYLVKLELLRSLCRGVHAHVIDPEDEYTRLPPRSAGTSSAPAPPGCGSTRSTCPSPTRRRPRTAPPTR